MGRPVLGTEELVRGMSRHTLAGYMRDHYGPRRMVLAAAGNIQHDAVVDMARRAFTDLPPDLPPPHEPARYKGGDYRESRDLEQVHLVLGFDGVSYDDPDFYASSVLSTLLGGGMSSRLFQEVREKRGLVYSIYSFTTAYNDGGLFQVYAGTGEDEVSDVVPVVCDEIMKVTQSVNADEVQRARAQLKASILMSLESSSSRCEQVARQMLAYGRPVPVDEVVAKVEAVDEAAVVAAARRLFNCHPTFAAIGPLGNVEDFDKVRARLG
jgi:predicted Zn-dependent peptidase